MRAGIGQGFTTFPYLLRIKMPLDRLHVELWNFYICRFLGTAHRQNKYLSVLDFGFLNVSRVRQFIACAPCAVCMRRIAVERVICRVCLNIPAWLYIAVLGQNAVLYKGNRACVFNRACAMCACAIACMFTSWCAVCVKLYAGACSSIPVYGAGVYWIQW